ncbi:hypothetical protein E2I00_015240 [Balaenoptera physalus]|uniref:HSac2 domain-containing protein n=1 Tax=Balaenoptera physalus TaxID=9770 RepID=A0A643CJ63_BALPH|nr:hypothetical protein E2I00_015240 [Balaenoptera physalus]
MEKILNDDIIVLQVHTRNLGVKSVVPTTSPPATVCGLAPFAQEDRKILEDWPESTQTMSFYRRKTVACVSMTQSNPAGMLSLKYKCEIVKNCLPIFLSQLAQSFEIVSNLCPTTHVCTYASPAEEMSTIGSFEGFQPVSLKQEGDDQTSETDQLSTEEGGPGTVSGPRQTSRSPSVTESALYPSPYHQPYISRKYFVTWPGPIETATEDLKGHIAKTSGEKIQGFWLLTE